MISTVNFQTAINILEGLTSLSVISGQSFQFEGEYNGQHPITSALKILSKAALEGTDQQKNKLLASRYKIISLNTLLRSASFSTEVSNKLGIEMGEEITKIKEIQIPLPQAKFEKMLEIATIISDVLLLPGALALLLTACCKINFNPKLEDVKYGIPPVLLLHGSGFNESEWLVGRQFLKEEQYGSVFSLNYDGLISNDPSKGIEDYARCKISAEVKKIKKITGSDRVILIGHSMGGLIAGYYAEYFAQADKVNVEHVISIASPWQGTPLIDYFWQLGGCYSKEKETKRHQQMSVSGGNHTDPNFRQTLVAKALDSEKKGIRKYYNIWSTTDYAVPGVYGSLTEDSSRQRSFNYLGHYALVAWPSVWLQIRSWLNKIYTEQEGVMLLADCRDKQSI